MTPTPLPTRRRRRSGWIGLLAAAAAAVGIAVLPLGAAHAEDAPPSDGLAQVIDPNQAQGAGRVVLDDGHIDFGPTLNTGEWIIQIHDDTSSPSYWRMLGDVVAQVGDGAKLAIPEGDAYAFLGLDAGAEAWVIPQVREPGVIWAGWNTQEPNVLGALNLGTTLRVLGVDGPGSVSVFLQSGNFGEPEALWSSTQPFPQESWIEVNTHTHANWVFSEPGVYLVEIEFAADLVDGSSVSARDTLRFAVGDQTDPEAAFDAVFDDSLLAVDPGTGDAETGAGGTTEDASGLGLLLGIVAAIVAAALLIAIIVVAAASGRAKERARRAAAEGSAR